MYRLLVSIRSIEMSFITTYYGYYHLAVSAYQHTMRICVYCYLLHIVIMWLDRNPPRTSSPFLLKVVTSPPLRLVLGLRFTDVRYLPKYYT